MTGSAFRTGAPRGKRSGLPVGVHVVFGIGVLLILLMASVLVALVLVLRLGKDGEQLGDRNVPYSVAIAAAALNAKGVANDERGFLITGDKRYVLEASIRTQRARAAFASALQSASTYEERAAVGDARTGFERWVVALQKEFARFRAGDSRSAVGVALGPHRKLRKDYERHLAQAQNLGAHAVATATMSVDRAAERSLTILLAYLVAALVLGVVVSVWLVRAILQPVYLMLKLLNPPEPTTGT